MEHDLNVHISQNICIYIYIGIILVALFWWYPNLPNNQLHKHVHLSALWCVLRVALYITYYHQLSIHCLLDRYSPNVSLKVYPILKQFCKLGICFLERYYSSLQISGQKKIIAAQAKPTKPCCCADEYSKKVPVPGSSITNH